MGAAACKAKVILNGGAVEAAAQNLCYLVDETDYNALSDEQWKNVILQLNAAEESMFKAQRLYLEGMGFDGPWPKSMK